MSRGTQLTVVTCLSKVMDRLQSRITTARQPPLVPLTLLTITLPDISTYTPSTITHSQITVVTSRSLKKLCMCTLFFREFTNL